MGQHMADMESLMAAGLTHSAVGPVRPIATRPLTPPEGSSIPQGAGRRLPEFPLYPGNPADASQPHIGKPELSIPSNSFLFPASC